MDRHALRSRGDTMPKQSISLRESRTERSFCWDLPEDPGQLLHSLKTEEERSRQDGSVDTFADALPVLLATDSRLLTAMNASDRALLKGMPITLAIRRAADFLAGYTSTDPDVSGASSLREADWLWGRGGGASHAVVGWAGADWQLRVRCTQRRGTGYLRSRWLRMWVSFARS